LRTLVLAACAQAATLRWSAAGDYLSADPHAQNEGTNNLINDEIFERLIAYDKQLGTIPSLATAWEQTSPRTWRFSLRKGVSSTTARPSPPRTWSIRSQRSQLPSSNFKVFTAHLGKARAIDAQTGGVRDAAPSPAGVFRRTSTRCAS
jgi:peptide/nickel transport system substrate-binding protein